MASTTHLADLDEVGESDEWFRQREREEEEGEGQSSASLEVGELGTWREGVHTQDSAEPAMRQEVGELETLQRRELQNHRRKDPERQYSHKGKNGMTLFCLGQFTAYQLSQTVNEETLCI